MSYATCFDSLSTTMFTQHMNYRLASDTLLKESILFFFSDLELASKNGTSSLALSSIESYHANGILNVLAVSMADWKT